MRLEDMRNETLKMPEDMRAMVEREVAKQINTTSMEHYRKRKGLARKSIAAALAMTIALGTTVFAGVVYHMHSEAAGNYAVKTTIAGNETTDTGILPETAEITPVKLSLGYLPEGMAEVEPGKYCYEDAMYLGGVEIGLFRMDTGDTSFQMTTKDVIASEDITLGGYDGVYLELNTTGKDAVSFNQRIYLAYTDQHYVLNMLAGSNVSKEELLKIAENITLVPTDETDEEYLMVTEDWSSHLASLAGAEAVIDYDSSTTVPESAMKNTHAVGETFSVENSLISSSEGLMACVADVQYLDDISVLLDSGIMSAKEAQEVTGEDGTLLPATLEYLKYGDGTNTTDEVVKTREVPQKLVYASVEFTNTGDSELSEVLFLVSLMKIKETDGYMTLYFGEESADGEWDGVAYQRPSAFQEMCYYDVHGGEQENNYISSIEPGETVTVHVAFFVPEEELEYCYLNLDCFSGPYSFSDTALAMGYVDIRP